MKLLFRTLAIILMVCINSIAQDLNEYISKGLKQIDDKNYNEAIESFTKAIEIDSKNAAVYCHRGLAKFETQDFYGAIKDFENTLKIGHTDERYIFLAYYTLGLSHLNLNRYEKAVNYLDSALVLKPKNADIYLEKGKAKINLGRIEEGCEDFSRAGELGNRNATEFIRKYCVGSVLYEDNVNWIKYGETIHFITYYDPNIIKKSDNIFFVITKQVINEANYEESKKVVLGKLNDSRFINFKYVIIKYSVDIQQSKTKLEEGEWYSRDNSLIEKPDFQKVYEYYNYDGWKTPVKNSIEETLIKVVKTRFGK